MIFFTKRKQERIELVTRPAEKEGEGTPTAPNVDASAISNENIVIQKDASGKTKMLVKDATGKIVAELKPVGPGVAATSGGNPPSAKQVEKVRMDTKLSVAGIKLPPNATREQVQQALKKEAAKRRKVAGSRNNQVDLLVADYSAEKSHTDASCHVPNCKAAVGAQQLSLFRIPRTLSTVKRTKWLHAVGQV